MGNERFDFKQFSIRQDKCAMKVGTDGVLIGSLDLSAGNPITPIREGNSPFSVLDIGTGTGLIALMTAQKLASKNIRFHIDAIEIDSDAAVQAEENAEASPWSQNIQVIHSSLQDYSLGEDVQQKKYDIIVSNPPFYNATLKPEDEARAIARHKDALPLNEITDFAKKHLSENGELRLIYPIDYDTEVMLAASLSGLHPITITDVVTKKGKPCKRRMATFALPDHPQKEIERNTLYIRDEKGNYTTDYLKRVNDFYLHLS